jgi:mannose-6-phosphate isomerase
MASSDNVLRGGLTPKHVDVPELLRILDFRSGPVSIVPPTRVGALEVWKTPAREFELSRARGDATIEVRSPLIALCTAGTVSLTDDAGTEQLGRGESVFVPGTSRQLALRGEGTTYLATCGERALSSKE